MDFQSELERKVIKKRAEITRVEAQLTGARSYLQALEDTLAMLTGEQGEQSETTLRPGSRVAKAREAILEAGHPLQVLDLLKAIGDEPTKKNRATLSGSLGAYVRRGEIFTRPAPNTYGLAEQSSETTGADDNEDDPAETVEPPEGFGLDSPPEVSPSDGIVPDDDVPF